MAAEKEELEMAPDPDEDDLDDLDDILDKFDAKPTAPGSQSKPISTTATAPAASGPGRPPSSSTANTTAAGEGGGEQVSSEDLEAQLQNGMADLISQLGDNPDMQKQFEEMMQELMAAGTAETTSDAAEHVKKATEAAPSEGPSGSTGTAAGKREDSFQDTIRKTMERMQQSGDAATAASASAGGGAAGAGMSEEDMLAQMMKELGGGEGGPEDFNQMLLNMMTQLTNKEILYEPMKELNGKFPGWLEKNGSTAKAEDRKRYEEQAVLVKEIVERFERSGYSDDNEEDREYIVERMQKMQAAGSPPPDLVGDMNAAQEALGELDAGCPTQ